MARVEINEIVIDNNGRPLTGASVLVSTSDGDPAIVYAGKTGSTTVANPLTTTSGRIEGWVEPGSYDLAVSYTGASYTQQYEAVSASSLSSGTGRGTQAQLDSHIAGLSSGTEYAWMLTNGSGVLLDIKTGVK